MNIKKCLVICILSIFVVACAPTLSSYEMMPKSQLYDALSNPKSIDKNISIGDVVVDKGMGGMTAPISSEQYREAIASSLRLAGWYKTDGARYRLDAHLKEIDQPIIGFAFTVKSKAEYTLTEVKNGKVRYQDEITMPCTVTMAEAFAAEVRLRKATGCAISENITHLLKVLSQRY